MALKLADAIVYLATDESKLKSGFASAQASTNSFVGSATKLLGGALVGGAVAAGAAVIGIGKAALSAEGDFDNGVDAIINATGASGEALAEMGETLKALKGSSAGLGVSMEEIGAAMGEVNTRTGLTGVQLQGLTSDILEFSRLTGGDAVANTRSLTRVMGDWGIENENASELLNSIYASGQVFGIGIDSLAGKLVQFGAPLRQMGFSLEESTAMLGKWEKEGVNTELVIGSLRIAAGNFARDNIPLRDGLNETMAAIKGAANESEGLALAMDVFGARAGPDMAAAIREGRFELDEAITSLQGMDFALADAANETLDWRDQWSIAMAQIGTELIPVGQALGTMISAVLPYLVEGIRATIAVVGPFIELLGTLSKYLSFVIERGDPLNDWLTDMPRSITGVMIAVGEFINWIRRLISSLRDGEVGALKFSDKYAFVGERLSGIMTALQALVGNVLRAIQGFWEQNGAAITTIMQNAFRILEAIFRTSLDFILGMIEFWVQLLSGDFRGAATTLIGIFTNLWAGVKEIFRLELDYLISIIRAVDWAGAGRAIVDGIRDGINAKWGDLEDWFRGRLEGLRNMLPFSEPRDASSPLRGLRESGQALVSMLQSGIDDVRLSVPIPSLANMQPIGAAANGPMNIVINVNGNGDAGQAVRGGVLSALRQAGLA